MNPTPTHPVATSEAVDAAEAAGIVVWPHADADGEPRFGVYVRGRQVSEHGSISEAQAAAATALHQEVDARVAAKLAAADAANEDAERTEACAQAAADASILYPEADPITYDAGRYWVTGRPHLTLPAAMADVRVRGDEFRRQRDFEAAVTDALEETATTTELHEGDKADPRDNRRAPWIEQVVDVYRPATAGNLPRNGTVQIVDGRVKVDTCTRFELAEQLGVPLPETADGRARRNAALEEAHHLLAERARMAKAEAERAALAMHHATL